MSVSVIILTYNSRQHLPALFRSLADQTYPSVESIVVDNASQDDTVTWLRQQTLLHIDQLIANTSNDWFAQGNNRAIPRAHGDYILFCNDDVVLTPDCISQLVSTAQLHPRSGMVGGKLLKLSSGQSVALFDSAGLRQYRSGRVVNRGENEPDQGQHDQLEQVFGITGALMLVRRTALEQVKYHTEYFDEDFIAYKEDIDLSWRMRRAGFEIWYQPQALAYHARSIRRAGLTDRLSQPTLIRAYSYRNHLWTLLKNVRWRDLLWTIPGVVPYEIAKLCYCVVRERSTVSVLPQAIRLLPKMWHKRRASL